MLSFQMVVLAPRGAGGRNASVEAGEFVTSTELRPSRRWLKHPDLNPAGFRFVIRIPWETHSHAGSSRFDPLRRLEPMVTWGFPIKSDTSNLIQWCGMLRIFLRFVDGHSMLDSNMLFTHQGFTMIHAVADLIPNKVFVTISKQSSS